MVKGDRQGLHVIISEDLDLQQIVHELVRMFNKPSPVRKKSIPIKISFEGKYLTKDKISKIKNALIQNGINIQEKNNSILSDKTYTSVGDKEDIFIIGDIKNGESIFSLSSIIIVGDVEKGSEIYSLGNVIVIGKVFGLIKTGLDGRQNSFYYSINSGRIYR